MISYTRVLALLPFLSPVFVCLLILFLFPSPSQSYSNDYAMPYCFGTIIKYDSQGAEQWVTYLPDEEDYNTNSPSVLISPSGAVLVDVTHYDPTNGNDALVRLDENGQMDWYKLLDSYNVAKSTLDPSGDWIHLARNFLIKHNENGNIVWNRSMPANNHEPMYDLETDGEGNIYLTGWITKSIDHCILTKKINSEGKLKWKKKFVVSSKTIERGESVAIDSAGNVYVIGNYLYGHKINNDYFAFVIKYDSSGNKLWTTDTHMKVDFFAHFADIIVDDDGFTYVCDICAPDYEYILVKLSPDGEIVFAEKFGNGKSDQYFRNYPTNPKLKFAADGTILVMAAELGDEDLSDFLLVKFDTDGTLLWSKRKGYDNGRYDVLRDIAVDHQGNIYITGGFGGYLTYYDSLLRESDFGTFAFDQNGQDLWSSFYNDLDYDMNFSESLAVDDLGNVFVSGKSCYIVEPSYPDDDDDDDDDNDDSSGDPNGSSDDSDGESEGCGC